MAAVAPAPAQSGGAWGSQEEIDKALESKGFTSTHMKVRERERQLVMRLRYCTPPHCIHDSVALCATLWHCARHCGGQCWGRGVAACTGAAPPCTHQRACRRRLGTTRTRRPGTGNPSCPRRPPRPLDARPHAPTGDAVRVLQLRRGGGVNSGLGGEIPGDPRAGLDRSCAFERNIRRGLFCAPFSLPTHPTHPPGRPRRRCRLLLRCLRPVHHWCVGGWVGKEGAQRLSPHQERPREPPRSAHSCARPTAHNQTTAPSDPHLPPPSPLPSGLAKPAIALTYFNR